jgi:glycosyltransferase involved in cell wall biosynthesis
MDLFFGFQYADGHDAPFALRNGPIPSLRKWKGYAKRTVSMDNDNISRVSPSKDLLQPVPVGRWRDAAHGSAKPSAISRFLLDFAPGRFYHWSRMKTNRIRPGFLNVSNPNGTGTSSPGTSSPGVLKIIDSDLMNRRGHHYEYVKSIYDEWVGRGLSANVYCSTNADMDIVRYFGAEAVFSRGFQTRCRPVPGLTKLSLVVNFIVSNAVFSKELKRIGSSGVDQSDVLLIHTIDPNQLFGLYFWYRSIRPEHRPRAVLIFRLGVGDNPDTRRYSTFLYGMFFRAAFSVAGRKMVLFSDSVDLAGEYEALAKTPVTVLPIPHIPDAGGTETGAPDGKYVVLYPGEARVEKGYHLLPRAVGNLLSKREDVRFVIQSNVSGNPSQEVLGARVGIKALKKDVEYIDRILESEEYYEIMRRADAILLPYSPETYRKRTSGILAEAMAFGKPVVVPGGTWMERQIAEYGHCGIVMNRYDEESLEEAIDAILDNREEYHNRARGASVRWRKFHNAMTYVDMLIDATR